jgi:ornithine carbamoyltransferase
VAAAVRLGAYPLILQVGDLQTNTGETIEDTIAMLSLYLDMLVVRTAADPAELRLMAKLDRLPIVNAMTSDEHPTQGLSDLATMHRHFGSLSGLRLLYSGEGNNTAVALAYAISRISGMEAEFVTPPGYGLHPDVLKTADSLGKQYGGKVRHSHSKPTESELPGADIVYATRWQTTGTTKCDPNWHDRFVPYRVTESLMARQASHRGTVFMHDLPAVRGEDCDGSVLDGPQSISLLQAGQKLFTAMAIIERCTAR